MLSSEIRRIQREACASTLNGHSSQSGLDTGGWLDDACAWLRGRYPDVARAIDAAGFAGEMRRALDEFIRSSRSAEVAGAADLDKHARLQARIRREFVVFYGEDGKPIRKLLRDVAMHELPKVVAYYRVQSRAMSQRADRYEALHEQMTLRGFGPTDLVGRLVS